jgi:hypothetical protein
MLEWGLFWLLGGLLREVWIEEGLHEVVAEVELPFAFRLVIIGLVV